VVGRAARRRSRRARWRLATTMRSRTTAGELDVRGFRRSRPAGAGGIRTAAPAVAADLDVGQVEGAGARGFGRERKKSSGRGLLTQGALRRVPFDRLAARSARLRAGQGPPRRGPQPCSLRRPLQGESFCPASVGSRAAAWGEGRPGVPPGAAGLPPPWRGSTAWGQDHHALAALQRTPPVSRPARDSAMFALLEGAVPVAKAPSAGRALTGQRVALAGQLGGDQPAQGSGLPPPADSGGWGLAWICKRAASAGRLVGLLRIGTAAAGPGWRRRPGDWPPRCAPPCGHSCWRIASRNRLKPPKLAGSTSGQGPRSRSAITRVSAPAQPQLTGELPWRRCFALVSCLVADRPAAPTRAAASPPSSGGKGLLSSKCAAGPGPLQRADRRAKKKENPIGGGHQVGLLHQVAGVDRVRADAQRARR